ncbi:hypothetical protein BO70DRAFT_52769 [Aspergillus heteromorphus CBS 117.55]|uniref:Uncharacterized protein n=1 Tax=Aspergillus heteromorphus CBS 117.55 TaxID=1448321 RepID=A0A317W105_9EURO|nr:uncharacterized protein BO70DRAFT_52769 [Aspergillus heteromorphus CBS 117.55]PWY79665.1 hypothetical protein BO70DRAFT_52769 [Aspergillus heteromorphus CBS 117.55]
MSLPKNGREKPSIAEDDVVLLYYSELSTLMGTCHPGNLRRHGDFKASWGVRGETSAGSSYYHQPCHALTTFGGLELEAAVYVPISHGRDGVIEPSRESDFPRRTTWPWNRIVGRGEELSQIRPGVYLPSDTTREADIYGRYRRDRDVAAHDVYVGGGGVVMGGLQVQPSETHRGCTWPGPPRQARMIRRRALDMPLMFRRPPVAAERRDIPEGGGQLAYGLLLIW